MKEKELIAEIIAHSDNEELMDKINKLSFAFTSKYKNFAKPKKQSVLDVNSIVNEIEKSS